MLTIILLIFALYHIISWSGGKDSTATIILFKLHWNEIMQPGDKAIIVFAEIMFDAKKNISGHNPQIIKFMYEKAKIFESWGFEVRFLRANGKIKDFLDFFYHTMGKSPKHPEHEGMLYGFPSSGTCGIKRDLKFKPINDFKKEIAKYEHIDYVGIAKDEPDRLVSLYKQPNTVSLLDKYDYTEEMARKLCEKNNMLSPQYSLGPNMHRDGCIFCPNAHLCEHKAFKDTYPDAWKQYVELENVPNVAYNNWNVFSKETLHDRDAILNNEEAYAKYLESERNKELSKELRQLKKQNKEYVQKIIKYLKKYLSEDNISWMKKYSYSSNFEMVNIFSDKSIVKISNASVTFFTKSGKRWYIKNQLNDTKVSEKNIADLKNTLYMNIAFYDKIKQSNFIQEIEEDRNFYNKYFIDKKQIAFIP